MIITEKWLNQYKTPAGGYNKKQIGILGLQYPLQKGWKRAIIGKELSDEKAKQFEHISDGDDGNILQFINKASTIPNSTIPKLPVVNRLINISDVSNYMIDSFIYTDGACIHNGTVNAVAGIGIYFGEGDIRNVSKQIIGKTNNIAELQAIIDVYNIITEELESENKKYCIVSDSIYALRCITEYGESQSKTNWTKDIPNKELVKYGYELYKNNTNIYFMYVKAHTENTDSHSIGNDGADKLANKAIGVEECPYNTSVSTKIYVNVPFSKNEEIKKLGGKWDNNNKKWYIYNNNVRIDYILDKFK